MTSKCLWGWQECFARRQVDGLRLQSFLKKLPWALAFLGLN